MLRLITISATIIFVLLAGCHCQRGKAKKENPPKPPAIAPGKEMAPTEKPKPKPKEAPPKPKTKIIAVNEIAFEREGAVWLMDWQTKKERKLVDGHLVTWLPDGQGLIFFKRYANNVAELFVIDLGAMETRNFFTAQISTPKDIEDLAKFRNNFKKDFKEGQCLRLSFDEKIGSFVSLIRPKEECEAPEPTYQKPSSDLPYLLNGLSHGNAKIFISAKTIALNAWNEKAKQWNIFLYDIEADKLNFATQGSDPILSPNGQWILYREKENIAWLSVAQINGAKSKQIAKGYYPTWLSDQRVLYFVPQEIRPKKTQVASLDNFIGHGPTAEPYYRRFRGRLKIHYRGTDDHELVNGFCTDSLDFALYPHCRTGAPSPDEKKFAFIGIGCDKARKRYLGLFDLENYTVAKIKKTGWAHAPIHTSSWSPNGRYLAVPNLKKHRLKIIDVANSKTYLTLQDANNSYGWSWSPDSQYFIYEKDRIAHYAYLPNRHIQMKLADGRHALWCPATEREIQIP